jgi:hypothetical protein
MCKQHLNTFAMATRLLKRFGFSEGSSYLPRILIDASWDSAERRFRRALRLQWTAAAIARARKIQNCLSIVDQLARRRENLAGRTGVNIALLIEREDFPTEGAISAIRLVDYRNAGSEFLVLDQPVEVRP